MFEKIRTKFWPLILLLVIFVSFIFLRFSNREAELPVNNEPSPTSTASVPKSEAENLVPINKPDNKPPVGVIPRDSITVRNLQINGIDIRVMVADTPQTQFKGLSDRLNMGEYGGMLFDFGQRSIYTMVMRDMNFPLDLVWIDGDLITYIVKNAQPERGVPERELTKYSNNVLSNYVLELPAGFTDQYNVKKGDKVVFK